MTSRPAAITGGMSLRRTVNLATGIYTIDGGELAIESNASINGSQLTFFLTNGATFRFAGNADIDISAPTSGTFAGILIFVDPNNNASSSDLPHIINGSSTSTLQGAIYAPTESVEIAGTNESGGGCTQIVARTVRVAGTAGLGSNCTGVPGVTFPTTAQFIRIID